MADHINILEPDTYSEIAALRIQIAKLEAELKMTNMYREAALNDLEAIFTRIGRGEMSELRYRSGRRIVIAAVVPDNG